MLFISRWRHTGLNLDVSLLLIKSCCVSPCFRHLLQILLYDVDPILCWLFWLSISTVLLRIRFFMRQWRSAYVILATAEVSWMRKKVVLFCFYTESDSTNVTVTALQSEYQTKSLHRSRRLMYRISIFSASIKWWHRRRRRQKSIITGNQSRRTDNNAT